MTENDLVDGKMPGKVSFSRWQAYPWKNELNTQLERVLAHCREILDDNFDGPHSPQDMLERSLVLAAFCVRRLIEKRLVSDDFASTPFEVKTFTAIPDVEFRRPFHCDTGGSFFTNYDCTAVKSCFKPKELADEIIHSSQLMVISGASFIEDGILLASDWHLQRRIIHFSPAKFRVFVTSVLDNEVKYGSDSWDPETGKVTSIRG